eukprot:2048920-Pyramimonas_sp.AAC.1
MGHYSWSSCSVKSRQDRPGAAGRCAPCTPSTKPYSWRQNRKEKVLQPGRAGPETGHDHRGDHVGRKNEDAGGPGGAPIAAEQPGGHPTADQ